MNDTWGRKHRDGVLLILGVGVVIAGVGRWVVTGDPYAQLIVAAGMGILGILPVIQRGDK